jgi:hypothetical protein
MGRPRRGGTWRGSRRGEGGVCWAVRRAGPSEAGGAGRASGLSRVEVRPKQAGRAGRVGRLGWSG